VLVEHWDLKSDENVAKAGTLELYTFSSTKFLRCKSLRVEHPLLALAFSLEFCVDFMHSVDCRGVAFLRPKFWSRSENFLADHQNSVQ